MRWLEIDESKSVKKSAGMGGLCMNYSSFKGEEISFNKGFFANLLGK